MFLRPDLGYIRSPVRSPASFGPPTSFRSYSHVPLRSMEDRSRLVPPPPLPMSQSLRQSQFVQEDLAQRHPQHGASQYIEEGHNPNQAAATSMAATPARAYPPVEEPLRASLLRTNASEAQFTAISDTVRILSDQLDGLKQSTSERFRKLYVGIEQVEQRLTSDESLFKLAEDLTQLQKEQKEASDRAPNAALDARLTEIEERLDGFDRKVRALGNRVENIFTGLENMAIAVEKRLEEEKVASAKRIREIEEQAAMHVEASRSQMDARISALEEKITALETPPIQESLAQVESRTTDMVNECNERISAISSDDTHTNRILGLETELKHVKDANNQYVEEHKSLETRFMELLRFLDGRHARSDEHGAKLAALEGEVSRLGSGVQRYRVLMAKLLEQAADTELETDEVEEGPIGGIHSPSAHKFATGVAQVANALIESAAGREFADSVYVKE